MPLAVYILGLGIFAQGTSELMLAGLLPEIAADLRVTIADAGLLISGFAAGMLVGAPVLAVVTRRWPRRTALLVFLAIFALAHVAGAVTSDHTVLLWTRGIGAFVYAGFWAIAAAVAIGSVPESERGKAMGVVAGGLTVATVVGLPAGTMIGQQFGWRAAFWVVAVMSALAMIGVRAWVPADRPARSATATALSEDVRRLRNPRLWLAYLTTALSTTALLVSFSYLAPLLTGATGIGPSWVPAVLVLYGIGSLIGISVGARTSDRWPIPTLWVGITGVVVVSVGLATFAEAAWLVLPLVFLLGAFGFGTTPTLNSRPIGIAGGAETLVAAGNVSAFNLGITAGPWLGGIAIDSGAGYPSVGWIGAVVGVLALAMVAMSVRAARREAVPVG